MPTRLVELTVPRLFLLQFFRRKGRHNIPTIAVFVVGFQSCAHFLPTIVQFLSQGFPRPRLPGNKTLDRTFGAAGLHAP